MRVVIEQTLNGWTIEDEAGMTVIEVGDTESEVRAARRLLYDVLEMLGFVGSRFDKERISIVVEPGDKYLDD